MTLLAIILGVICAVQGLLNWLLGRELNGLAKELTIHAKIACATELEMNGPLDAETCAMIAEACVKSVRDAQRRSVL